MAARPAIALVGAALAVGAVCGGVADAHLASVALLLFEPVLWIATAGAAAWVAFRRGVRAALLAVAVTATFSAGVRVAGLGVSAWSGEEVHADARLAAFGECARGREPPREARVAVWNVLATNDDDAIVRAASALDVDVLVMHEVIRAELGRRIARAWDGESIHEKAIADWGTTIVVRRGRFVRCAERTRLVRELAAERRRRAIAVATMVEVRGGRFPLVTLHTDRPTTLGEAARWPDAMRTSSRRVAAMVRAIDHSAVVVAGDTNTHATFHRFHATIERAGVEAAPPHITWPARLSGVPFVPLYALDRVWTGPHWELSAIRTVRLDVPSDHLAIVASLSTRSPR